MSQSYHQAKAKRTSNVCGMRQAERMESLGSSGCDPVFVGEVGHSTQHQPKGLAPTKTLLAIAIAPSPHVFILLRMAAELLFLNGSCYAR